MIESMSLILKEKSGKIACYLNLFLRKHKKYLTSESKIFFQKNININFFFTLKIKLSNYGYYN